MVEIRTQWIRRFYNAVNEIKYSECFILLENFYFKKPVE